MQKLKTYHKLLSTYATSAKLELSLLLVLQVGVLGVWSA